MIRTSAVILTLLLATTVVIALQSFGQEKTTPTNKDQSQAKPAPSPSPQPSASPSQPEDFSTRTWDLPADAEKTKNPVPATEESIAKGKELYFGRTGNCVFCHGDTGAGNEANLPKLRRKPADLSNKERMTAMTDGEVFWKISKGIPGIMPAGEKRMNEQERWHVVNFVRTVAKDKAASGTVP